MGIFYGSLVYGVRFYTIFDSENSPDRSDLIKEVLFEAPLDMDEKETFIPKMNEVINKHIGTDDIGTDDIGTDDIGTDDIGTDDITYHDYTIMLNQDMQTTYDADDMGPCRTWVPFDMGEYIKYSR